MSVLKEMKWQEAVAAYLHHGKNVMKAAKALEIAPTTLSDRIKAAARAGYFPLDMAMPGYMVAKTSSTFDDNGNVKSTSTTQKPDTLGGQFEVPAGFSPRKITVQTDGNGNVTQRWDKLSLNDIDYMSVIKGAFDEYKGDEGVEPIKRVSSYLPTVTVYPVADLHIGLLAWAEESGENYDLSIGRKVIQDTFLRVLDMTPNSEQAVFLGLGDLMHSTDYSAMTPRSGNHLDVDGRFPKVLREAIKLTRWMISKVAEKHDHTTVRILSGNHDITASVAVNEALSVLYEDRGDITFINEAAYTWYYRTGEFYMAATHGDMAKMKDIPMMMAVDRPQDWANSSVKRGYTGHIHHQSAIEEGGVTVKSYRTPVAKDAYHAAHRYRSGRSMVSETFRLDGTGSSSVEENV